MKKLVLSLFILLTVSITVFGQDRTVTGTVTAREDGLPIPGATVRVKEVSGLGTSTSADGKFSISVPASGRTLVVSFLGYVTQEVVISSNNIVEVTLSSDARTLDAVVVTAGGVTITNRQQGNQATTVKSEVLTQAKAFNVASGLQGKVAGLQVNAISSGVNPNIRLVLRGNRSLLGNNQALVVVDNVIVPTSILGNINPEDIEDVQVLNGAGAAALYGSDASNGALIITTKKGRRGATEIRVGNTTNLEKVSFLPEVQKRFGSGTTPDDIPSYTAYENQQYGPEFDGIVRPIGKPLQDGSIQMVPYSYTDEKDKFWETGLTNQTDLSISSGDEKTTYYVAAQYLGQQSTVPSDQYNRFSIRANGTRDLGKGFNLSFSSNYVQNRYDQTSGGQAVFENVLMSPGQVPLTSYKDWKNNPFANPNGYYNEYYDNPYFTIDNNRSVSRNDYLTGNAEIRFKPISQLELTYRVGLSSRNYSNKTHSGLFRFSDYTLGISGSAKTANEYPGSVSDNFLYETQINSDFLAQYQAPISEDISLNAILGASLRDNDEKSAGLGRSGLIVPDLYNVAYGLQNPTAAESNSRTRQLGVYADVRLGYKNYLYLHLTGRNDWRSVLAKGNRSFFYPSADISFIASDVVPFIKESGVIESLKLRGGWSKVGLVNIGPYSLLPTFGSGAGYPYQGTNPGFGLSSRIVAPQLNPEITTGYEGGFDIDLYESRITATFTAYKTSTTDQTVPVQISNATGFTSYLTNTGEVTNEGIETMLRVVPVRMANSLEISIGANYTYNDNKVVSISEDLEMLTLGTFGNASIVASKGQPFPLLRGTVYQTDPQGRYIINPANGYPAVTTGQFDLGRTEPVHRLGLDALVSFKRIRFATLFEYRAGHSIYTGASTGFDFSGAGIRTTYFNRDRFVMPNSSYESPAGSGQYVQNTNIQTRSGGGDFWTNGPSNTGVAANYTYSAAFWKLREASISYDIPKSVFGNVRFVQGATISLIGRNLLLFTPDTNIYTDPEYSAFNADSNAIGFTSLAQTPPARMFGASISVTF